MQEKNTLDELFKGKKGFAECYQTLQLLSESTDDYLFLADLKRVNFISPAMIYQRDMHCAWMKTTVAA